MLGCLECADDLGSSSALASAASTSWPPCRSFGHLLLAVSPSSIVRAETAVSHANLRLLTPTAAPELGTLQLVIWSRSLQSQRNWLWRSWISLGSLLVTWRIMRITKIPSVIDNYSSFGVSASWLDPKISVMQAWNTFYVQTGSANESLGWAWLQLSRQVHLEPSYCQ